MPPTFAVRLIRTKAQKLLFQTTVSAARAILTEVKRLMVTSPRGGKVYRRLSTSGRAKLARIRSRMPSQALSTRDYIQRVLRGPSRAKIAKPLSEEEYLRKIAVENRPRLSTIGDHSYRRTSAPGEPPAPDRGMAGGLISRLAYTVQETTRGVDVAVGAEADPDPRKASHPIPAYLEEGTQKMRPRPAWGRAIETVRRTGTKVDTVSVNLRS